MYRFLYVHFFPILNIFRSSGANILGDFITTTFIARFPSIYALSIYA